MKNDTVALAHALSGSFGFVSPDDLVNYGQTVIVKPGAKTSQGAMLTGDYVASALGDEFAVFPLAVEYSADDFGADLKALDNELEALGDDLEIFGGSRGVRKRYQKVLARYRKCMTKLQIKQKRGRQRRCDRRYKKMVKRWQKMKRKQVDLSGLQSPEQARASFRQQGSSRARYAPQAMPLPAPAYGPPRSAAPAYGPPRPAQRAGPSRGYFADQAALEREMVSVMPSYGRDQAQLAADLRSGTDTFALSGIEHDYFGLGGSDVDVLYTEDQLGEDDDDFGDDDDDFGDDDFGATAEEKLTSEMQALIIKTGNWGITKNLLVKKKKLTALGLERDALVRSGQSTASKDKEITAILLEAGANPDQQANVQAIVDKRDALIRMSGDFGDDDYGAVSRRRAKALQKKLDDYHKRLASQPSTQLSNDYQRWMMQLTEEEKKAMAKIQRRAARIPDDDDDLLGDDDDDLLGDDDDDLLGDDDDDLLGDDDDDLLGDDDDDLLGDDDDDLLGVEESLITDPDDVGDDDELGFIPLLLAPMALMFIGQRKRKMKRWLKKGEPITSKQAKKVAKWRTRWKATLAKKTRKPKRKAALESNIRMANELLSRSAMRFGADGEVDYTRIRRKTPGTKGKPVVVIGIRKRPTEQTLLQGDVVEYAAAHGHHPDNPGLLDVIAVGLIPDVYKSRLSYAAPEAMAQISQSTHVSDWFGAEVGSTTLLFDENFGLFRRMRERSEESREAKADKGEKRSTERDERRDRQRKERKETREQERQERRLRVKRDSERYDEEKIARKAAAAQRRREGELQDVRFQLEKAKLDAALAKLKSTKVGATGGYLGALAPKNREFMGGASAFPIGSAPPFPPPRKVGPEVR